MEEGRQPEHLVVGHVSKPHGTKGEVFVWPLTDRVDAVFAPGRELLVEPGEEDQEQANCSRPGSDVERG